MKPSIVFDRSDKNREPESRSAAENVAQKQVDLDSTFHIKDNRPKAIQMQKLQDKVNDHVKQHSLQLEDKRSSVSSLQKSSPHHNSPLQRYPYVSTPSKDLKRKDALIYGIYRQIGNQLTLQYVGQTSMDRAGSRFVEHVDYDAGQPWHGMDITRDESTWAYVPRKIWAYDDVTKLEITVSETFWIEKHNPPRNGQVPLTKAKWEEYKKIPGNFYVGNAHIPESWTEDEDE